MLLPYASDRPPRNPPLVTVSLVLIHFLVFGLVALVLAVRGPAAPVVWYANLSLVPGSLHWYALITYAFLHEDVLHLSANMLFLWVFGGSVEDAIGWKRFLGLYAAAVILAGALQVVMGLVAGGSARLTPILGASGAISAIVGVFAVRFYRSRIRFIGLPFQVPALLLLAMVMLAEMGTALWQIAHRMPAGTAHWAHIGGFILGVLWAEANRMMRAGRHEYLATDAATDMERGSPLAAAQKWEAVLLGQPDNLHAEAELGRAWALVGDREQSVIHYRRAIAGFIKQGDKKEAAARLIEARGFFAAIVLDSADQFAVAGALEESGEYSAAAEAFETFLQTYPDVRESETARLRIAALWLKRLDSPDKAEHILNEFMAAHPTSDLRPFAEEMLRSAREARR